MAAKELKMASKELTLASKAIHQGIQATKTRLRIELGNTDTPFLIANHVHRELGGLTDTANDRIIYPP